MQAGLPQDKFSKKSNGNVGANQYTGPSKSSGAKIMIKRVTAVKPA